LKHPPRWSGVAARIGGLRQPGIVFRARHPLLQAIQDRWWGFAAP